MKKLIIVILIGVAGYFGFHFVRGTGPFVPDYMVAPGSMVFEGGTNIQKVNLVGAFDANDLIEQGQPTVIEFYSNRCPGCIQLNGHLKQFVNLRPDVAVQQILLSDYWRPDDVLNAYKVNIRSVPHIIIYGPDGNLVARDEGMDKSGFEFLYKWMNDELKKDWNRRHKR
jgi:hypothetical protein